SPWYSTKENVRQNLVVSDAARSLRCPVAYVNCVGGNDELIFDGRSLVCDAQGRVMAGVAAFAEDQRVVEIRPPAGTNAPFEVATLHPSFAQDELKDMFD